MHQDIKYLLQQSIFSSPQNINRRLVVHLQHMLHISVNLTYKNAVCVTKKKKFEMLINNACKPKNILAYKLTRRGSFFLKSRRRRGFKDMLIKCYIIQENFKDQRICPCAVRQDDNEF